jgi:CRISPR/Cas system CSM-associated protein Csm3 (group 7 of RAMP superfamily)
VNGRRAVAVRHEVTGTLKTVTAVRPGGWGSSAYADLIVARDGLGRLMIPGTSLAGALRSWLGSVTGPDGDALFDQVALRAVFGYLEHRGQMGTVCRIMVDDAVADDDVGVVIRDGVGIDRGTGSAAAGILYQQEVIPPGTRFAVRITAALSATDTETERAGQALDLLVRALAAGRVEIGAARTRGLGRVQLTDITRTQVDLADRAQVLSWLCGRPAPAPAADGELSGDGRLGIEVSWSAVTPVMVRASTVNEAEPGHDRAVDTVPLRSGGTGPDGSVTLLLPGSSVKGVLRSHAERIVRTVTAVGLPDRWLDQVNDPRLGQVTALFGTAGDRRARDKGAARDGEAIPADRAARAGRRGALSVQDCLGTAAERVVTHVAVDRWTGGAAENLLFSVQEPASADWQPMRMSLDAGRVGTPGDQDGGQALALLLLVLRDLADGWLALGFGGTRGRGSVRVSRVAFTGGGLPGIWAELPGRTLAEVIDDPPDGVRRAFAAWQEGASA